MQHLSFIGRSGRGVGAALVLLLTLLSSGCAFYTPPGEPPGQAVRTISQPQQNPRAEVLLEFARFRLFVAHDRWDDALAALENAARSDPGSSYLTLLLARVYLHLEHPDSAIALLDTLLEQSSDNGDAHLLLGDIYLQQQRTALAHYHVRRSLELDPADEIRHLRLAMVYLQLDQSDEALTTLQSFLQQQPDAERTILSLARIYRDSDQYDSAHRTYRQYLSYYPGVQQVVLELGRMLEGREPEAAGKLYQQTLVRDPFAVAVRQQLVQLHLALRQSEEALEHLEIVNKQFPSGRNERQLGLLYLQLERFVEAESAFRILLATAEKEDRDHYYLALTLSGQEHYADAIMQLEKVSPEADIYLEAALQLAYLYFRQEQFESAISLLEGMIAAGRQTAEVYYYLIAFGQELRQFDRALQATESALELYPQDGRFLYQQGLLYHEIKDKERAFGIMEEVLLIDSDHADALNYIAYAQAEAEADLPLALARAQRALELKQTGYIEDTVGWVYFKMGDYEQSLVHLRRALELQPDDPVILEHLGDVLVARHHYAEAAEVYRQVLQLDPEAAQAAEKLDALHLDGKL